MRCEHLSPEGKCQGPYTGFGCIKEKCTAKTRTKCEYNELGFYCRKFKRFECIGPANCESLEEYLNYVNERRKRAQLSK